MSEAEVERLAERAVERLSDDETLRGRLSDAGFAPLFDWAVAAAQRAAVAASTSPEPAATLDGVVAQLRAVLRAAAQGAAEGRVRPLLRWLGPPLFSAGEAERARACLRALRPGDDVDANARAIAAALRQATSPAGAGEMP